MSSCVLLAFPPLHIPGRQILYGSCHVRMYILISGDYIRIIPPHLKSVAARLWKKNHIVIDRTHLFHGLSCQQGQQGKKGERDKGKEARSASVTAVIGRPGVI